MSRKRLRETVKVRLTNDDLAALRKWASHNRRQGLAGTASEVLRQMIATRREQELGEPRNGEARDRTGSCVSNARAAA